MHSEQNIKDNRNIANHCRYPVVWCPKYRRKVFINSVDRLKEIIYQSATEQRVEVIELEVMLQ
ncbi:MAG: transposase [Chloroflexi bacterium]|nr:transposase [Chloroflexota bacterium]